MWRIRNLGIYPWIDLRYFDYLGAWSAATRSNPNATTEYDGSTTTTEYDGPTTTAEYDGFPTAGMLYCICK